MKTVLITGASRGIGASCAVNFAKAGYNVVINYNNSEEKAKSLEKIIKDSYNVDCICIKADVSDYEQVRAMFEKAYSHFGNIDVLVNNAGISSYMLFTDTEKDEWDKVISTNLNSVYYCCKCVLPQMIKNHSGIIVNISSMWGQTGASCEVAYSTSKAGVIGLTKALSKEVGPSNIRVNCVAPGVITTDMMNGFDEKAVEELKDETPLSCLGTPKDVADSVVFLCSEKAKFITGQVLSVNGGILI
ncbi:MAG: SDR family oxidoreductase [Oscillospiraceae bacterium]|nr:SDR family oxidoreductase [Candidatus Ruminococcus equi]